jgi:4-amino-4-deoxy-L-arabinose transferase-like glycosyltransferase
VSIRKKLLLVLCLAGLLSLPWLNRAFYSRGEPREAIVAQAMLATGNWISPPAYDGAVPSKPPFSHWLIAIASQVTGEVTETTSRLPSALAFIAFNAAFFVFLARRISARSALVATLLLLSFPMWFSAAVTCRVDTILATSFAGGLIALFAWFERGLKGFPILAVTLLSAATLTKGPVAVVLPLAIFGFFLWSESGFTWRRVWGISWKCILVGVPVLAVASLWYIAAYLERGDEFLSKVWYENFDRMSGSMHDEPHKHSVFYLFGTLALGLLPWSLIWIVDGLRVLRGKGIRALRSVPAWYRALPPVQRFAAVSALLIVLFFCVPSSKRGVYLLPAYPFIALLGALSLEWCATRYARTFAVLTRVAVFIGCLVIGSAGAAAVVGYLDSAPPILIEYSRALRGSTSLLSIALFLWLAFAAWRLLCQEFPGRNASPSYVWLSTALIAAVALASLGAVGPIIFAQSPKRWATSEAFPVPAAKRASLEPFYSFGSEAYATSFYLQKPFKRALGPVAPGSVVVMQERDIPAFREKISVETIELGRFQSAFEDKKRALVVVETR